MVSKSNNPINNKVGASISGVTNTLTITNPSNTASSAARETITVGGTSAANPTLNWNIVGSTDFEMGLDNADSQKLKIAQSTALGTKDVWRMTKAGQRTLPLQPAFLAVYSASVTNATGDGTVYTAVFDTKIFDVDSNYNNATGIFTAPVTGVYLFTTVVNMSGLVASNSSGILDFFINNTTTGIHTLSGNPAAMSDFAGSVAWNGSIILSLNATDTIRIKLTVTGGPKTVTIIAASYPTFYQNTFSGALLF